MHVSGEDNDGADEDETSIS